MPLPVIAVVAARLGIKLATYMIGKQLKKGAAKKLRKAITKKRAEIAKEKEAAGKAFKGKGPQRKQEKVTQRKEKDKSKVDSDLSIKKYPRSGKGKRSRNMKIGESPPSKGFHEQKYKTTVKVKVKHKGGLTHTDEIKGMNEGHALARAKSNWPGSAVIKIK